MVFFLYLKFLNLRKQLEIFFRKLKIFNFQGQIHSEIMQQKYSERVIPSKDTVRLRKFFLEKLDIFFYRNYFFCTCLEANQL
jgi:hypothetical protein